MEQPSPAPPSTTTPITTSTPQSTDQQPPPQPQKSQQPPPQQSTIPSSLQPSPNPNPIPKPQTQPPQSQSQPSSHQPSHHLRPPFNRPWQPPSSSPFFPSVTTHSPSPTPAPPFSSPAATSVPPAQRGGMAIGVPAHHAGPSPGPSPFSSMNPPSFGQQFGGLGRSSLSGPESVPGSSNPQMRQSMQGMQGMGMLGSLGASSSLRPSGVPAHLQQRPAQSSLRPQTSQSSQSSAAQNFQGHGLLRGPSLGSPSPGSPSPNAPQSLQTHNQPWLSSGPPQGKPPLAPPPFRPPTNTPSMQQRSHIGQQQQQHTVSTPAQQQQTSSSPQPQQQSIMTHQQLQEHYALPPSRVPPSLSNQQPITRGQGLGNQKSSSQTFGQPGTNHPTLFNRNVANAEAGETCNRILSKRSIQEIVTQIDPSERLDPELEDILVDIADEFVESHSTHGLPDMAWVSVWDVVQSFQPFWAHNSLLIGQQFRFFHELITTFGCSLAKHRKSNTLEAKDILLHLERNWNMTLPGFSGDEIKVYKKPFTNDIHKERLAAIRRSVVATEAAASKIPAGQASGSAKGHPAKGPVTIIGSPNP